MPDPRARWVGRTLKLGTCLAAPLLVLIVLAWGGHLVRPVGSAVRAFEGPSWPSSAGEVETSGARVEALGGPPLGAVGTVLQLVVVLACPAMFVVMWALQRFEQYPRGTQRDRPDE